MTLGVLEFLVVGALVGQGSGGAAVGSHAMINIGLKNYLGGSIDEIYYGKA